MQKKGLLGLAIAASVGAGIGAAVSEYRHRRLDSLTLPECYELRQNLSQELLKLQASNDGEAVSLLDVGIGWKIKWINHRLARVEERIDRLEATEGQGE